VKKEGTSSHLLGREKKDRRQNKARTSHRTRDLIGGGRGRGRGAKGDRDLMAIAASEARSAKEGKEGRSGAREKVWTNSSRNFEGLREGCRKSRTLLRTVRKAHREQRTKEKERGNRTRHTLRKKHQSTIKGHRNRNSRETGKNGHNNLSQPIASLDRWGRKEKGTDERRYHRNTTDFGG